MTMMGSGDNGWMVYGWMDGRMGFWRCDAFSFPASFFLSFPPCLFCFAYRYYPCSSGLWGFVFVLVQINSKLFSPCG